MQQRRTNAKSVRVVRQGCNAAQSPCNLCAVSGCHWDQLGKRSLCPDCQVALLCGEAPALVLRMERRRCAICWQQGTLRYLSFPLHETDPVEIDFCPMHLRDFMARRLGRRAFLRLRRQLNLIGLAAEQIFLLHESFYDESGTALHPLPDVA